MKFTFTCTFLLLIVSKLAFGQFIFQSKNTGGSWSSGATWTCLSDFNGNPCAGNPAVPTASDIAFVIVDNGSSVTLSKGSSVSIKDLYVIFDVPNAITQSGGIVTAAAPIITINGTLQGINLTLDDTPAPTTTVIQNSGTKPPRLVFTGTNQDDPAGPVIINWGSVASLTNVTLSPGANEDLTVSKFSLASGGLLTVANGTSTIETNESINDPTGSASIVVNSGATLKIDGAVHGTNNSSKIASFSNNGTVTIGTQGYLNAENLSFGSGSTFNIFSNQSQGWWYQTTAPAGAISLNGDVYYSLGGSQSIATIKEYNNLILAGSGTKSGASGNSLFVNGTLTIGSGVTLNTSSSTGVTLKGNLVNNGSWSPSTVVKFEGAGTQVFSGNMISFDGGIDIGNSTTSPSTVLELADNIDVNGRLRLFTNATLNQNENTVFLAGDLSNSGTITNDASGGATFQFDGVTTLISGSQTAELPNIIIGGGTLSASSNTLNITGNFTNNSGTFNANNGTVNFNGTSPQIIAGTGVTFKNLTISNSTGVINNSSVMLEGALTLTSSGVFDADGTGGNLTVRSTGLNSSGRIAAVPATNNLSGNVTIQRFIDGPDDWRYLSIPIRQTTSGGTPNVAQWKVNFPVTGKFSDPSPVGVDGVVSSTSPSIFRYNAATQAYAEIGNGASTTATTLDYRTGYSVYTYKADDFTISISGLPVTGSVTIPLSATSPGWNLIPNPYPSPIDWDLVTTTGTNSSVYMTTAQGAFATYVKGSPCTQCSFNTGWTGEIAIGQSFWIQSTGATSLSLTELTKVGSATFVREAAPRNYFRIVLSSANQTDDAIIRFTEDATSGFDSGMDAPKRKNGYFDQTLNRNTFLNVSTYSSQVDEDLAINVVSPVQCSGSLKIKVSDMAPGAHILRLTDLDKMYLGYNIVLVDHLQKTEKTMLNDDEYVFDVTTDPATYDPSRFELRFTSPEVQLDRNLGLMTLIECDNQSIKLEISNSQPGIQYLFKLDEVALHEPVRASGGVASIFINKSLLDYGSNSLSLVAASYDGCNAAIIDDAIRVSFDEIKEISSVTAAEACGSGSLVLTAEGNGQDGLYRWYETEDGLEPIAGATTATFTTPELTESKTYYVVAINGNGCESITRVPVDATIKSVPKPEISVAGNVLSVNAKTNIQWYKDGEIITGATGAELMVKSSGSYTVQVSKNGCSGTSAGWEFSITNVENKQAPYGVEVYPNPTDGMVEISGFFPENSVITVFDSKGNEIEAEISPIAPGKVALNLLGARKGLYLINIQSENRIIQLKAVKK